MRSRCFNILARSYCKRITSNEFGNLSDGSFPLEKMVNPKALSKMDEINRKPKQTKVISVPLSGLSKKKIARIIKEQEYDPLITKTPLLIECSNQKFNQTVDFSIPRGSKVELCSQFWAKNKYSNYWFKIKRQCKNVPSLSQSLSSWNDFIPDKLSQEVMNSLIRMELYEPLGVQVQCLHSFLSTNHLFIASETGSGKTVAFAAPLISWALRNRKSKKEEKAIVITATAALKQQIHSVFQTISLGTGVRVAMCEKGQQTNEDWDILIGTPGLVQEALSALENPSNVKQMVFDEADMLLDEGFTDVLTNIFAMVPIAHSETNITLPKHEGARIIFCSASCPEELECIAEGVVDRPYLSYIKSKNLHSILKNIEMTFIRTREKDKLNRLSNILESDLKRGEHNQSLVFCKDKKTAKFVHESLETAKVKSLLWTGELNESMIEDYRVLVATDAASRGLDLPRLRHVINYDMARHNVDFVHRIGRVGRLGSRFLGSVTSFVRTPYEVALTNQIELAARLRKPLRNIETDVTSMVNRHKEKEDEE